MMEFVKPIKTVWGAGFESIIPPYDRADKETLEKWYNSIISTKTLVDTAQAIAAIYEECKEKAFSTFMELWLNDYDRTDTVYMTRYSDDYYGDFIIVGFEYNFSNIHYYMFEVK